MNCLSGKTLIVMYSECIIIVFGLTDQKNREKKKERKKEHSIIDCE